MTSKYEKAESVLMEWFQEKLALNLPIYGPILKGKKGQNNV
jgi:hypothetical protein